MRPEDFFAGHPLGAAVFLRVQSVVADIGDLGVRVSKSQVAFRRKRAFAYLWMPAMYLTHPGAEVVLSIALGRHDRSTRFKQVVHPTPKHWIHHLELHDPAEIDDEVATWIREAATRAA
jgi:hypothetical protein